MTFFIANDRGKFQPQSCEILISLFINSDSRGITKFKLKFLLYHTKIIELQWLRFSVRPKNIFRSDVIAEWLTLRLTHPPSHRMSDYKSDWLTGGSTSQPTERQINLFTLVTRRPYCPGRPKELCFTKLSLAMETMGMRLSVVKQSFFGPPGQYGRLVTRANWPAK